MRGGTDHPREAASLGRGLDRGESDKHCAQPKRPVCKPATDMETAGWGWRAGCADRDFRKLESMVKVARK